MTLSLSILVPYRPDGDWRDRSWNLCVGRYLSTIVEHWQGDAELIIETPPPEGPGTPADFNHPLAINRAAERSSGELLMVCDADCLPDPGYMGLAERAIRDGLAQWTLPRFYRMLTERATLNAHALGELPVDLTGPGYEWIGDSVSWAGCPIYPRAAFLDAGGYDERIAWWGGDDICMGLTMTTLYGPAARVAGVTHLWHPHPPEHNYGHERHPAQWSLVQRYIDAAGAPDPATAIRGVRFP